MCVLIPFYYHYYYSYYCCVCVPWHTGSSWRTVCRSRFSPSTTWVSGMGLGLSGLVASASPCWVISQSFTQHFWPQIHGRIFPRTNHFSIAHWLGILSVRSDTASRCLVTDPTGWCQYQKSIPSSDATFELQVTAHTSDQVGFLHPSSWHGEFPEWLTELKETFYCYLLVIQGYVWEWRRHAQGLGTWDQAQSNDIFSKTAPQETSWVKPPRSFPDHLLSF